MKKQRRKKRYEHPLLADAKIFRSYPGATLDLTEKEIPIVEIPVIKKEKCGEILFMGDFHVGSDGFSETQLIAHIDWLKKHKGRRVILMGDLLEVAELASYFEAQKENFKAQLVRLINLLRPIKDQILVILEGNHEERYAKYTKGAVQLSRYIALELGIADRVLLPGPQRGQFLVIKVGERKYPIYVIHGSTGAIIHSNTQLRRMAFRTKVPLIAHGHIHKYFTETYVYESVTQINDKFYKTILEQIWLTTGAFVKDLGYAEAKSYPLTKIGAPLVRFYSEWDGLSVGFGRDLYQIGMKFHCLRNSNTWTKRDEKAYQRMKRKIPILNLPLKKELIFPKKRTLLFSSKRPSCPRCGRNHIQSKGCEWGCCYCGRRWAKKKNWGRSYEEKTMD